MLTSILDEYADSNNNYSNKFSNSTRKVATNGNKNTDFYNNNINKFYNEDNYSSEEKYSNDNNTYNQKYKNDYNQKQKYNKNIDIQDNNNINYYIDERKINNSPNYNNIYTKKYNNNQQYTDEINEYNENVNNNEEPIRKPILIEDKLNSNYNNNYNKKLKELDYGAYKPKSNIYNLNNNNIYNINNNNNYNNIKYLKMQPNNNVNTNKIINNNIEPYFNSNKQELFLDYIPNECFIKYVTLNRQGFENIHERNYLSGLLIFQKCYDLSKNYLKDKIKEINSLINISICEYYNGNFKESLASIQEAKQQFETISLGECRISAKQKNNIFIKLYLNSSLSNLSTNNYKDSINDIKKIISLIEEDGNINKQFSYFRTVLYTLFKVESLINYDFNEVEVNEPVKIINHLIKGFLLFLKEKNYELLLNIFKEATQKYKRLNDFNGYYFSLYYQYLILYHNNVKIYKNFDQNEINEIKNKISICNKKLIGDELVNEIKEKDTDYLLNDFVNKINCSCEIYKLLETLEYNLNDKLNDYNRQLANNKNNASNLSDNESNLSYSNLMDKSHLFTNKKISSPIFIQLLLKYSISFLNNQKQKNINDSNNYDILINEIKILVNKINSHEINIDKIKLQYLDNDMLNSLKQLFDNLVYIYYKSKLYKYFHKFIKNTYKAKNSEFTDYIIDFLETNYNEVLNGTNLIKINFKSRGYKIHFYNIDEANLNLNCRKSLNETYPNKIISIQNDVLKIIYGLKSKNIRKKLLSKEKDNECMKLFRFPWRFISIITKDRSIDLYCDDIQINNWFYGFKYLCIDNKINYKICTTNSFVLNKLKFKIVIVLKQGLAEKGSKDKFKNAKTIINQLCREKAIQTISFTKLFLLYNKYFNLDK